MSKYKIEGGNIGAVGDHSQAKDTYQTDARVVFQMPDLSVLAQDLAKLKAEIMRRASTPEQSDMVAQVAEAEVGAKNGDRKAVLEKLAGVGKWVLDVAKDVGTDVAAKVIAHHLGVK